MKKRQFIQHTVMLVLSLATIISMFTGCRKKPAAVPETEEITLGIDVARYQGTIDWQQVADAGIDFAMIRVGYRAQADGVIKEDPNARYNLQEAEKAGVKIGAYFFSTAVSEEEAREEAAWVADLLSGYPITYPVAYDCENFNDPDSRQYHMTRGERTDMALAFLATIESLGYEGMFYGSKNDLQFENAWITSRIEDAYKIWVAQYPDLPYPQTEQSTYSGIHHMWQYSTEGAIAGITQPVDLNVAYFGYDGINVRKDKKAPEKVEPNIEAMMDFRDVDELVTAKQETNLRDVPSQDSNSQVIAMLKNGDVAQRVAVCNSGWSKLVYEGRICYAVSSYLTTDLTGNDTDLSEQTSDDDGIETKFKPVNQQVTAKDTVNLRKLPSVEHEDADIIGQLKHGETATCVGVSDNGWAKLHYNGQIYYAVYSYLEHAGSSPAAYVSETTEIQTQFETVSERVTAKDNVNLRNLPSTEHPDCVVVANIKNGEVVTRTGINRDVGWSRVEYHGQTLYCVSSYLTEAE